MTFDPDHYRERPTPGISANELARFVVATDLGREGIIRNSRWQGKVRTTRYRIARNAIGQFLADRTRSPRILGEARSKLDAVLADPASTPFKREDATASILALDNFQRRFNQFEIGGLNFEKPWKLKPLVMEGVEVAVTLDAVTRSPNPPRIGGLILRMSRGDGETDGAAARRREIGRNAAVLIFLAADEQLANGSLASSDLCYSVDVQHGEAQQTPRNYLAIVENMQAACRAIAAQWDSVRPPGSPE